MTNTIDSTVQDVLHAVNTAHIVDIIKLAALLTSPASSLLGGNLASLFKEAGYVHVPGFIIDRVKQSVTSAIELDPDVTVFRWLSGEGVVYYIRTGEVLDNTVPHDYYECLDCKQVVCPQRVSSYLKDSDLTFDMMRHGLNAISGKATGMNNDDALKYLKDLAFSMCDELARGSSFGTVLQTVFPGTNLFLDGKVTKPFCPSCGSANLLRIAS